MSLLRSRWAGMLWLALVWVLLWGTFTPLTVVGGVVVAGFVMAVSRQAPPSERLPVRLASALSLAPGAMALEIDHSRGVWHVYSLGPRDDTDVRNAWLRTMDMQRRVLATFGTPEELARAERLIRERALR